MTRIACCSIAPPDLLARIIEEGEPDQRAAAVQTMAASASMRTQRAFVGRIARELGQDVRALTFMQPPEAPAGVRQAVYDLEHGGRSQLPGRLVRGAGDPAVEDAAVNDVYEATEATYDFYREAYGRDSVDGRGMELISTVHYSTNFDNAFWNGAQMVYGDGSGRIFNVGALTGAIDVMAHELTHGVTQFTAGLEYSSQSGALNESFSDILGSLVKQRSLGQTVEEADWLIGEGALVPALGTALRSLKAPGTAYEGDRQPAHMDDYVDLPDDGDPANDNGGVHINSSIQNHAFYLAASAIGGYAWEKAGKVWYETLTGERLSPSAEFEQAATATVDVAAELFGEGSEREAVETAWRQVGVLA
jgi:Zn-dependent metalloprotease